MNKILLSASILALTTGSAMAAGIERSNQSLGILFEEGSYAELTFGSFDPDVSGTVGGVLGSGDMSPSYNTFSLGYKTAINDRLDFALILDEPVGADVEYPTNTAPYPFVGATAEIDSTAITGVLRYKLPSHVSLIGGLRIQQASGEVGIPTISNYTMTTDTDTELGYLIGIAWEKPEIAARVSLTYNSEITHDLTANESFSPVPTTFETTIPQSVNLEFQTGVAADTLLFGSLRWVDWSEFDVTPPAFAAATGGASLASLDSDYITYTVGLGRKFSEQWSGAVILGYEPASGDLQGNLGPTDGFSSIGLAATYKVDNIKLTGGVRYVEIGDATTRAVNAQFVDNSGVGFGLRMGVSF